MKKYLRLVCNVCKRTTDKLVDNERVVPDRCVITLNCQGRLLPVEYRSNGEIATSPQVGITDWYARDVHDRFGTTVTKSVPLADPVFINTSTGSTQQLVLALPLPTPPTSAALATLELSVRADTPKNYKQYTFRYETTFSTVSGVETASEKKTLRFTAYGVDPDLVEVYINGVKREQGTAPDQYQIYDGAIIPTIPPNMVSFNTPVALAGTTQVDVIVSKTMVLSTRSLAFFKNVDNPARTSTGAWENVDSYQRLVGGVWTTFYVFTYDVKDTTDIDLNTIMAPTGDIMVADVGSALVPLTSAFFLLARKPYSTLDRYPDIGVRLSTMSMDRDYLKYHLVDTVATLEVVETAVSAFYPPARLAKFDPEPTIKTPIIVTSEQITVDGKVIVGPDT